LEKKFHHVPSILGWEMTIFVKLPRICRLGSSGCSYRLFNKKRHWARNSRFSWPILSWFISFERGDEDESKKFYFTIKSLILRKKLWFYARLKETPRGHWEICLQKQKSKVQLRDSKKLTLIPFFSCFSDHKTFFIYDFTSKIDQKLWLVKGHLEVSRMAKKWKPRHNALFFIFSTSRVPKMSSGAKNTPRTNFLKSNIWSWNFFTIFASLPHSLKTVKARDFSIKPFDRAYQK